jgi:hypothetical protein
MIKGKEFQRCRNVGRTNACHILILNALIAIWAGLVVQNVMGVVTCIPTHVINGRQQPARHVEVERGLVAVVVQASVIYIGRK